VNTAVLEDFGNKAWICAQSPALSPAGRLAVLEAGAAAVRAGRRPASIKTMLNKTEATRESVFFVNMANLLGWNKYDDWKRILYIPGVFGKFTTDQMIPTAPISQPLALMVSSMVCSSVDTIRLSNCTFKMSEKKFPLHLEHILAGPA
jgi:hypothetical protein